MVAEGSETLSRHQLNVKRASKSPGAIFSNHERNVIIVNSQVLSGNLVRDPLSVSSLN